MASNHTHNVCVLAWHTPTGTLLFNVVVVHQCYTNMYGMVGPNANMFMCVVPLNAYIYICAFQCALGGTNGAQLFGLVWSSLGPVFWRDNWDQTVGQIWTSLVPMVWPEYWGQALAQTVWPHMVWPEYWGQTVWFSLAQLGPSALAEQLGPNAGGGTCWSHLRVNKSSAVEGQRFEPTT